MIIMITMIDLALAMMIMILGNKTMMMPWESSIERNMWILKLAVYGQWTWWYWHGPSNFWRPESLILAAFWADENNACPAVALASGLRQFTSEFLPPVTYLIQKSAEKVIPCCCEASKVVPEDSEKPFRSIWIIKIGGLWLRNDGLSSKPNKRRRDKYLLIKCLPFLARISAIGLPLHMYPML